MHDAVIDFWFSEIKKSQWWTKDKNFDDSIITRFLTLHNQAIDCELHGWRQTGLGRLAEIIILDQFSRNMYRDTARAFASDAQALILAQEAVAGHFDSELSLDQRMFLYMPFMHSESLHIHYIATDLFEKLGVDVTIEYALKHRQIIERFGRYPHRNNILGRKSSQEEEDFLRQAGSSF